MTSPHQPAVIVTEAEAFEPMTPYQVAAQFLRSHGRFPSGGSISYGTVCEYLAAFASEAVKAERERAVRIVGNLAKIARASPYWEDRTADQLDKLEAAIRNQEPQS